MSSISKNELATISKKVKEYVEKNNAIPSEIDGVRHGEYTYLFAKIIIANGLKDMTRKSVGTAQNPNGDTIKDRKIYRTDYLDMCRRLVKFVDDNGYLPNWISWYGVKVHMHLYEYAFAKIVNYMAQNNQEPNYVAVDSSIFNKTKPKTYSQEILEYFENRFGKVSTIDGALSKIQSKGYGYYYDDVYSNKESIDRMKNGKGVNCTDSCHVFWHIGKALGYDVRAIHIKCRGGDGHIRLQFNKGDGWFNRDPATVLNGGSVSSIWCSNGTYLATNPQWFLNNLNR